MFSQRSMISAARGSVARASAFSASVMVSTRRVEDLVDLGRVEQRPGALRGHLRVVVQDDRGDQDHVGRPGRSGQHGPAAVLPALRRGRLRPASGGSSSETNPPLVASISRWAPISEVRIASSLDRARLGARVLAPRSRAARTRRAGSARPAPRRPAASGSGRPAGSRSCPASDRCRPPVMSTGSADRSVARRTCGAATTSCSTASSQRARRRAGSAASATSRTLELEEAQVHRDLGSASPAGACSRHWVASRESSPSPSAAAPGGPSTPNCQRTWFLAEVARYG